MYIIFALITAGAAGFCSAHYLQWTIETWQFWVFVIPFCFGLSAIGAKLQIQNWEL